MDKWNSLHNKGLWQDGRLGSSFTAWSRCISNAIYFLSAGTFHELTAWLRTWRQEPASSTTTTSALWRCRLEDTRCQVGCCEVVRTMTRSCSRCRTLSLVNVSRVIYKINPLPAHAMSTVLHQALAERTDRWQSSTTPSWRLWWWKWVMWRASSETTQQVYNAVTRRPGRLWSPMIVPNTS